MIRASNKEGVVIVEKNWRIVTSLMSQIAEVTIDQVRN